MMENGNTAKQSAKRASRIVLNKCLDITGAIALQKKLAICAARDANVNLNAAKVETIDTTSLQLLLVFVRQKYEAGYTVNWQSPSEALLKTADLTGLTSELGLADTE